MMRLLSIAAAIVGFCSLATAQTLPTLLGNFTTDNPAYLTLLQQSDVAGLSLFISQFTGNPFAGDTISVVPSIGKYLTRVHAIAPVEITDNITWPNEIATVPNGALVGDASFNGVTVAGGFLVPPKSVGAVHIVQLKEDRVVASSKVTKDKGNPLLVREYAIPLDSVSLTYTIPQDGWFYHEATWKDVDGDGIEDIVSARATKPLLGASGGQLVFMKQPAADPLAPQNLPWEETVLISGAQDPDVFFRFGNFGGDLEETLLYTTYFSGPGFNAALLKPGATWNDSSAIEHVVIDNTIGTAFGLELVDLNGDGHKEVLVTNHVDNATQAGVYAYEVPQDRSHFLTPSAWKRHTLASGFVVRNFGPGQAAPGAAIPFQPYGGSSGKPSIVLSGDGDQRAYILTPASDDPTVWEYNLHMVHDCQGTVGAPVVGNVDGDASGAVEVFIPCYDAGYVTVWTYKQ